MESSFSILLILGLIHIGSGLYFHIGETERKCFIEEVPDDTLVAGMFLFSFCFIFYFSIS